MSIPMWIRTTLGLLVVVGIGYVVYRWGWYIVGGCILFACIKGVLQKEVK